MAESVLEGGFITGLNALFCLFGLMMVGKVKTWLTAPLVRLLGVGGKVGDCMTATQQKLLHQH